MGAPPSSNVVIPPIASLLVRVLTFFCLVISMIVLVTNKFKVSRLVPSVDYYGDFTYTIYTVSKKFHVFLAYRYLISCIVIGLAYTIVQVGFSVIHVTSGKRIVESLEKFDVYPDLFLSNLLVSGAAASYGLTVDVKRQGYELGNKFYEKIYASTSLCFIAFVFATISTVISHLNARRKSTS